MDEEPVENFLIMLMKKLSLWRELLNVNYERRVFF